MINSLVIAVRLSGVRSLLLASSGLVTKVVSTTGTVNPELTIIVGSYVSGIIKDVYCDYNTQVKTG
jgi:HlyD family secretion protein